MNNFGKYTIRQDGFLIPCGANGPLPQVIKTITVQGEDQYDPPHMRIKFTVFIGRIDGPHCTAIGVILFDEHGVEVPMVRVHRVTGMKDLNKTPTAHCTVDAIYQKQ